MVALTPEQPQSKQYHIKNGSVIISTLVSLILAGYCATQPVKTKSVAVLFSAITLAVCSVIKATQLQKDYAIFRRTEELKMALKFYHLESALVPVEMTRGQTELTPIDIWTGGHDYPITPQTFQQNPFSSLVRPQTTLFSTSAPLGASLKRYLIDEATGILITGNSGAGKTSSALEICGMLTEDNPAQVIVLDPHFNDQWEQAGLLVISRIEEVETAILSLVKELDARHERKRLKQANGSPIIIITDELLSCKKRFKNPKLVGEALSRLSTEGRKREMLFIGISHSPNADDIDISAEVRTSFAVLKLCKSAQKHVANYWDKDDPRKAYILNHPGYPAIIADGVEEIIEHPTHAHHPQFKKNGQEPKYQHPIQQLEWTTLNLDGTWKDSTRTDEAEIETTVPHPLQPSGEPKEGTPSSAIAPNINLEKPPEVPSKTPQISLEELLVIVWKYAASSGEVSVREVQRKWDIGQKYKLSSEAIACLFSALQNRGWGDKIEANSLGKIAFKPSADSCPD